MDRRYPLSRRNVTEQRSLLSGVSSHRVSSFTFLRRIYADHGYYRSNFTFSATCYSINNTIFDHNVNGSLRVYSDFTATPLTPAWPPKGPP